MIRIITRRSLDVDYLVQDPANELDGVRDGPALWHPVGERVRADDVLGASARSRTTGYDVIVAAPRAMSLLLVVGTDYEQATLVRSHRDAVREALQYLERNGVVVHRQVLGERDELPTRWANSAAFTHGVNRAGEPHLHDHVLLGARGTSYPQMIDSTLLREHASSADALYRAHLRHELNTHLDREVWQSFAGHEFVSGVDEGVRAIWPGRANDRGDKVHWTRRDIVRQWRRDFESYEPGVQITPSRGDGPEFVRHRFDAELAKYDAIKRRDVVGALANAHPRGVVAAKVERAVGHELPELSRNHDYVLARRELRGFERATERDLHDAELLQRSRERSRIDELSRSRER